MRLHDELEEEVDRVEPEEALLTLKRDEVTEFVCVEPMDLPDAAEVDGLLDLVTSSSPPLTVMTGSRVWSCVVVTPAVTIFNERVWPVLFKDAAEIGLRKAFPFPPIFSEVVRFREPGILMELIELIVDRVLPVMERL